MREIVKRINRIMDLTDDEKIIAECNAVMLLAKHTLDISEPHDYNIATALRGPDVFFASIAITERDLVDRLKVVFTGRIRHLAGTSVDCAGVVRNYYFEGYKQLVVEKLFQLAKEQRASLGTPGWWNHFRAHTLLALQALQERGHNGEELANLERFLRALDDALRMGTPPGGVLTETILEEIL